MKLIKIITPTQEQIEATEYQVWRRKWDDASIQHVISNVKDLECTTRNFNRYSKTIYAPVAWIALPWINLLSVPKKLLFKIQIEGRWTLARHDDIAKMTLAIEERYKDGRVDYIETGAWSITQRMFYDEDEIFEIEGWRDNPKECIRFLLGIEGDFASRTTWKKGIGLAWKKIKIYANVEWGYFYLRYWRYSTDKFYVRRYKNDLTLELEKERPNIHKGKINGLGGITAKTMKEKLEEKTYAIYTKDIEFVKGIDPHEKGAGTANTIITEENEVYICKTRQNREALIEKYTSDLEYVKTKTYIPPQGYQFEPPGEIFLRSDAKMIYWEEAPLRRQYLLPAFESEENQATFLEKIYPIVAITNSEIAVTETDQESGDAGIAYYDYNFNKLRWKKYPFPPDIAIYELFLIFLNEINEFVFLARTTKNPDWVEAWISDYDLNLKKVITTDLPATDVYLFDVIKPETYLDPP
jgi:hypothetical protein